VQLEFTKQTPIDRGHDFGTRQRSAVFRWKSSRRAGEKLPRTRRRKLHQMEETFVILPGLQLWFRVIEPRQIFQREINSAILQILSHIADNIRHLQGQAEFDCILFTAWVAISKDLDADEANCTGDAVAINAELFECGIPPDAQVHFYAGNNFFEHPDRY